MRSTSATPRVISPRGRCPGSTRDRARRATRTSASANHPPPPDGSSRSLSGERVGAFSSGSGFDEIVGWPGPGHFDAVPVVAQVAGQLPGGGPKPRRDGIPHQKSRFQQETRALRSARRRRMAPDVNGEGGQGGEGPSTRTRPRSARSRVVSRACFFAARPTHLTRFSWAAAPGGPRRGRERP